MSPDEILKSIIEVAKIAVWPAVLVWIVWYLRDELKRVATRMTELGLSGAKFAPPPPEQTPSPPTASVAATTAPSPDNTSATAAHGSMQLIVERIKAFISSDQLEPSVQNIRTELNAATGNDLATQNELLVYGLASLNIQLGHERTYSLIFGSQLQFLAQMNTDWGASREVATNIYETAKANNSAVYQAFTFDQWLNFLLQSGLCKLGPNGNYVLTPYGRGLLKYILDRHLSVNKPY